MRRPILLAAWLVGCSPVPGAETDPAGDTTQHQPIDRASTAEPAASTPAEGPSADPLAASGGTPCGELGCRQYDSAAQAFAAAIGADPRVIAIGEAHAQKGTEGIPTATHRFTEQLLPALADTTSDIVLEMMIPDPGCKKETAAVETHVEKPVTSTQQTTNKSEFQTLAEKAQAAGIRPHVLRPTCDQMKTVADAGDEGVLLMLTLIATLSHDLVGQILARNQRTSVDKRVALYGGAMHNDVLPAAGRESWSYGPKLSTEVDGRYVEIDLIVPEYIKDNDTWKTLPWYPHYDRDKLGGKVTLFNPSKASYVLIFAATGK